MENLGPEASRTLYYILRRRGRVGGRNKWTLCSPVFFFFFVTLGRVAAGPQKGKINLKLKKTQKNTATERDTEKKRNKE